MNKIFSNSFSYVHRANSGDRHMVHFVFSSFLHVPMYTKSVCVAKKAHMMAPITVGMESLLSRNDKAIIRDNRGNVKIVFAATHALLPQLTPQPAITHP